jgi:hypothetical protein
VFRILRAFRLAERRPALAHAVMASHVAQPCAGEVERALTSAHHARAPPDLAQDALKRAVGAYPPQVLLREVV